MEQQVVCCSYNMSSLTTKFVMLLSCYFGLGLSSLAEEVDCRIWFWQSDHKFVQVIIYSFSASLDCLAYSLGWTRLVRNLEEIGMWFSYVHSMNMLRARSQKSMGSEFRRICRIRHFFILHRRSWNLDLPIHTWSVVAFVVLSYLCRSDFHRCRASILFVKYLLKTMQVVTWYSTVLNEWRLGIPFFSMGGYMMPYPVASTWKATFLYMPTVVQSIMHWLKLFTVIAIIVSLYFSETHSSIVIEIVNSKEGRKIQTNRLSTGHDLATTLPYRQKDWNSKLELPLTAHNPPNFNLRWGHYNEIVLRYLHIYTN